MRKQRDLSTLLVNSLRNPTVLVLKPEQEIRVMLKEELRKIATRMNIQPVVFSDDPASVSKLDVSAYNVVAAFMRILEEYDPLFANIFKLDRSTTLHQIMNAYLLFSVEFPDAVRRKINRALRYIFVVCSSRDDVKDMIPCTCSCPPDDLALSLVLESLNQQVHSQKTTLMVVIDCPHHKYNPAPIERILTSPRGINPIVILK